MSIGTKISEIRKSKKMKIETLSQKSGVPISTLKKYCQERLKTLK